MRRALNEKSRQTGGFRAVGANLNCELRTRILGLRVELFRATAPGIVFAKEGPVKFMYSRIYVPILRSGKTLAIAANQSFFTELC